MTRSTRLEHYIFIIRCLAAAVLLRSLIAPGFMLGVAPGGTFSIVFCNGPAGIYGQSMTHDMHAHHQAQANGQGGSGAAHVTPACTHWSTSGNYVIAAFDVPLIATATPDTARPISSTIVVQLPPDTTRSTRGPPIFI